MEQPTNQVLGFKVSIGSLDQISTGILHSARTRHSHYVCVANVHMLVEARRDEAFRQVVQGASVVTADGQPLTWALRLLQGVRQERVAGVYLMQELLGRAEREGVGVFFYGSTTDVLQQSKTWLRRHYPALKLAGMLSPPFRALRASEELEHMEAINASGAGIVFVALGCPKQERWMASMKGKINAVMVGIGAALPVMVGLRRPAPQWMQRAGLEWLFRLCLEPRRLFRRYAVTNTVFLGLLVREMARKIGKRETGNGKGST